LQQYEKNTILDTSDISPDKKGFLFTKNIPPHIFALCSILSIQLGSSLSESLFSSVGPLGATFLRQAFGAIILLCIWRPRLKGLTRKNIMLIVLFGVTLSCLNGAFYSAIARIPLGIAVSLEFVGPLGVAIIQSRHWKDLIWAASAAAGILLLTPLGSTSLDLLGIGLALLAACFWGIYILVSARLGRAFRGGDGLALSLVVATCVSAPMGIISGGSNLLTTHVLLVGLGVAILAAALPFSLEMEALRRLPSRTFGILMSIEPAVGAIIGFFILHQNIGIREIIAMAFIIAASVGVSLTDTTVHQV
jgi:inner membrane transporter RhtA